MRRVDGPSHRLGLLLLATVVFALCAAQAAGNAQAEPPPPVVQPVAPAQPPPPPDLVEWNLGRPVLAQAALGGELPAERLVLLALGAVGIAFAVAWIFRQIAANRLAIDVTAIAFWTSGRVVVYDRQADRVLCIYLAEVPQGFALAAAPLRALDRPAATALAHVVPTSSSGAVLVFQGQVGEIVQEMRPGCRYDISEHIALVFEPAYFRRA